MTGREVMAQIVADDQLKHLLVVVLTTSQLQEEILDMYRLRVNSYFTKPVRFEEFQQMVKNLASYWFDDGLVLTH